MAMAAAGIGALAIGATAIDAAVDDARRQREKERKKRQRKWQQQRQEQPPPPPPEHGGHDEMGLDWGYGRDSDGFPLDPHDPHDLARLQWQASRRCSDERIRGVPTCRPRRGVHRRLGGEMDGDGSSSSCGGEFARSGSFTESSLASARRGTTLTRMPSPPSPPTSRA